MLLQTPQIFGFRFGLAHPGKSPATLIFHVELFSDHGSQ